MEVIQELSLFVSAPAGELMPVWLPRALTKKNPNQRDRDGGRHGRPGALLFVPKRCSWTFNNRSPPFYSAQVSASSFDTASSVGRLDQAGGRRFSQTAPNLSQHKGSPK